MCHFKRHKSVSFCWPNFQLSRAPIIFIKNILRIHMYMYVSHFSPRFTLILHAALHTIVKWGQGEHFSNLTGEISKNRKWCTEIIKADYYTYLVFNPSHAHNALPTVERMNETAENIAWAAWTLASEVTHDIHTHILSLCYDKNDDESTCCISFPYTQDVNVQSIFFSFAWCLPFFFVSSKPSKLFLRIVSAFERTYFSTLVAVVTANPPKFSQ